MKPIVLATDGSPSAAAATLQAIELARALGIPLVAVSVEDQMYPSAGSYGYTGVIAEFSKAAGERVDRTLARASALAADAGVICDLVHAKGPVHQQVCDVAARHEARMIVIGAHGWGPLQRALHGSVSTAVVHEARCPVLVVPRDLEPIVATAYRREAAAAS